jgi:hypothetical protein
MSQGLDQPLIVSAAGPYAAGAQRLWKDAENLMKRSVEPLLFERI